MTLPSGLTVRRMIELTLKAHGAPRVDLALWERSFAPESQPAAARALLLLVERAACAAERSELSEALLSALPALLARLLHARLDEPAMNACAAWLCGTGEALALILSKLQILVAMRILSECAPAVDPLVPLLVAFHSGARPAARRGLIAADRSSLFIPAHALALLFEGSGMKIGLALEQAAGRLIGAGRIQCRARVMTAAASDCLAYVLSEEWLPHLRALLPEESLYERIEWTQGDASDGHCELIGVLDSFVRLPRALPARVRLQIGWAVRELARTMEEFPEARRALRLFWGSAACGEFSAADYGALFVPIETLGEDVLPWLETLEAAGSIISRETNLAGSARPALLHVRLDAAEAPVPGVMLALRADWNAPLAERQMELLARFRRSLDEAEFREENLAQGARPLIPDGLMKPILACGELEAFFPDGMPQDVRAALSEPAALHLAHMIGRARLSELAPALAALAETLSKRTPAGAFPEGAP